MIKNLLIIVILFICINIFSSDITDSLQLNEVVITASRSLQNSALFKVTIDSFVIKQNKENSLSDLLTNNSSVFIKSYGRGSLSTASFRGTSASHTQVLWNGIKINSPMIGQTDFSIIPVFFIDQLQILQGGSSIIESSGALGGTIVLENQPEWNKKFEMTINQEIASFHTYGTFAGITLGNEKWQTKTRCIYRSSLNDFKYYNTTVIPYRYDIQKDADYYQYALQQELYRKIDTKNTISFVLFGQYNDRNLPKIMSYEGGKIDESQQDKNIRSTLTWNSFINQKINVQVQTAYAYDNLQYYRYFNQFNYINNDSRSFSNSFFNNLEINYSISKNTIIKPGVDYNYYKASIFDYAPVIQSGYNKERNEISFYTALIHRFNSKIVANVLVRQEIVDTKDIPIIPMLGIEYKFIQDKDFFLKINVARNYHYPTLNDLYWIPGGNPNLKPEKGYTADIGIDFKYKVITQNAVTKLSSFVSQIDDWISWMPTEARYWQAMNLKEVFSRGVEWYQKIDGKLLKLNYTVIFNYAFTLTSDNYSLKSADENRNHQLPYIPKNKYNLFTKLEWKHFYFSYNHIFVDKRYTSPTSENNPVEIILNHHYLNNISIGRKIKVKKNEFDLQIKIDNLLNTDYQAILFRAMPGRYYTFTLQYKI